MRPRPHCSAVLSSSARTCRASAREPSIVFGDFRQGYRIFDRVALSVLRDAYSQATVGMTRFHGRRRVAGGVAKAAALRKLKIATS